MSLWDSYDSSEYLQEENHFFLPTNKNKQLGKKMYTNGVISPSINGVIRIYIYSAVICILIQNCTYRIKFYTTKMLWLRNHKNLQNSSVMNIFLKNLWQWRSNKYHFNNLWFDQGLNQNYNRINDQIYSTPGVKHYITTLMRSRTNGIGI